MSKDKINVPKASTLMGSLRSMGYTFESAVADVIDNSISAHASIIKILFPTNPLDSIAVGIMDNGDGMTDNELFEAMRYGCMASEIERKQDDLGRFGLGMKAASRKSWRPSDFNPDPMRAVWLSALFPGLGQIYNHRYWKLPIVVGGYVGLFYATTWNSRMLSDYQRAYLDIMDSDPGTNSYMDFFSSSYREEDRQGMVNPCIEAEERLL